jgi:hypothetical protein
MSDLDDPFDRDAQAQANVRLFRRDRSNSELLTTVHKDLSGRSYYTTGNEGFAQVTYSNPSTGFRSARQALDRPSEKHEGLKQAIRDQDYGDHFFTKKTAMTFPPSRVDWETNQWGLSESMHGWRWPCEPAREKSLEGYTNRLDYVDTATLSELFYWGGEGISRTLPTVPEASVVTAIGELGMALPRVPAISRFRFNRGKGGVDVDTTRPTLGEASDEFLNYTFGIAPTVSDAESFYSATADADKIIAQYQRDANRKVRRRISLLDESSTTFSTHLTPQIPLGHYLFDPLGNAVTPCIHTTTTRTRVWFSGSYQYSLPPLESNLRKLSEFNRLYGVVPTPEDLWNLTAWSWLADWHVNAGSVLRNLSTLSRDGIRVHYAYVMMEKSVEYTYSNAGNTVTFVDSNKNRVKASRFGFGLKPGSLSNKQRAILTALGVSRWS